MGLIKSWQERVTLYVPDFSGIYGRMSRCPSEPAREWNCIGRHTTKRSRSTSVTSLCLRLLFLSFNLFHHTCIRSARSFSPTQPVLACQNPHLATSKLGNPTGHRILIYPPHTR